MNMEEIAEVVYNCENKMNTYSIRGETREYFTLPYHRKLHYECKAKLWIEIFKVLKGKIKDKK